MENKNSLEIEVNNLMVLYQNKSKERIRKKKERDLKNSSETGQQFFQYLPPKLIFFLPIQINLFYSSFLFKMRQNFLNLYFPLKFSPRNLYIKNFLILFTLKNTFKIFKTLWKYFLTSQMFFIYLTSTSAPYPSPSFNPLSWLQFDPLYGSNTQKKDSSPLTKPLPEPQISQQLNKSRPKQSEKSVKRGRKNNLERDSKGQSSMNDQYLPTKRDKKKCKKIYENTYRNVMPNILHLLFCFIQKKSKSGSLVEKYFSQFQRPINPEILVDRFYCYHRIFKDKMDCSVNYDAINHLMSMMDPSCANYSKEQQQSFLKLNRILIKHFLSKEIDQVILTSKRMKKQNRHCHLQKKRILLQKISKDFNLNL